jgi:spermidine dehydrogenase
MRRRDRDDDEHLDPLQLPMTDRGGTLPGLGSLDHLAVGGAEAPGIDAKLGMGRAITRRDFLDGIKLAAGAALLPACKKREEAPFAPERDPGYYPPGLTGLRGSHVGSFEVAHQLRDGTLALGTPRDTGERYDLVIVGAGISGLAAAHYFRKLHGDGAKILLLDNHDDVGGHAKRNELTADGHVVISYGGTESIEYPSLYGDIARRLLGELGIDEARFHKTFVRQPGEKLGLAPAMFFDRETFGTDRLVKGEPFEPSDELLANAPLSAAARADLTRLYRSPPDYWPSLSTSDKQARLAKLSYRAFLLDVVKLAPDAIPWLQTITHSLYGVGIDAVPALDCWALELPGFEGMKLGEERSPLLGLTPLLEMRHGTPSLQFPDGNASVARLLVRRLVPLALPGTTLGDVVAARLDYARLDEETSPTRIRLNSTVVRTRHLGDPDSAAEVELTYVRGGKAFTVRGATCVLACWHVIIPYLAPELPEQQRKALSYAVKVPLIYANASIRNWRALDKLGVYIVQAPGSYYISARLEQPIDIDRAQKHTADEPAVIKLVRTPCHPGVPSRDQHRLGRAELLATPFEVLERNLRAQLGRMFGAGGFDPARDITAVTVNRWAHGYSYEYNSLWDPPLPKDQQPCAIARRRFGRIAIANADAGAYAYTDCAIEQAFRAVNELPR